MSGALCYYRQRWVNSYPCDSWQTNPGSSPTFYTQSSGIVSSFSFNPEQGQKMNGWMNQPQLWSFRKSICLDCKEGRTTFLAGTRRTTWNMLNNHRSPSVGRPNLISQCHSPPPLPTFRDWSRSRCHILHHLKGIHSICWEWNHWSRLETTFRWDVQKPKNTEGSEVKDLSLWYTDWRKHLHANVS